MGSLGYRPDIDGLRALAVVPVALYHAGIPGFPGGYAGVDVFFVISGFLITRLILAQRRRGDFSVLRFYERRARRLFPALLAVLLLTFAASAFLLTPEDAVRMLQSSIATLTFTSNLYFLNSTDYFAPASEFLPLLHTWSLAVEEQFYLIWPWCLIGFDRLQQTGRVRLAFSLLIMLIGGSFAASTFVVLKAPPQAFYLAHLRFWELGVGGSVAMFGRRYPNTRRPTAGVLSGIGLLMVVGTFLGLSSTAPFPGHGALPVVAGSALLVHVGGVKSNWATRFLRLGPIVSLGKLSYSLYLIHWPLLALVRNYRGEQLLDPLTGIMVLCVSVLLAACSYRLVEQPIRLSATPRTVVALTLGGVVLFVGTARTGIALDGLPKRIGHDLPEYASSKDHMWNWRCPRRRLKGLPGRHCVVGAPWRSATRRIVLWGDSHAEHFAPLFGHVIDKDKHALLLYRKSLPFVDNVKVKRWDHGVAASRRYGRKHRAMIRWLKSRAASADVVVMAAAWTGYLESLYQGSPASRSREAGPGLIRRGLRATIQQLPKGLPVRILTDIPRPGRSLLGCITGSQGLLLRELPAECSSLPRSMIDAWHRPTTQALQGIAQEFETVSTWDMVKLLCNARSCPTFMNGRLLYQDSNHFRRNFNHGELDALTARLQIAKVVEASPMPSHGTQY